VNHIFRNGRVIPNVTPETLSDFVRMGATDVYNEVGLENPFGNVTENPLPYMEDWVEMDKQQSAPQEEKTSNYLLGGMIRTAGEKIYDTEGM